VLAIYFLLYLLRFALKLPCLEGVMLY
jgi:hypothetical protein